MSFRDSIRVTMGGVDGKTRLTIHGVVYEGRCIEIRGGCVYVDGVWVGPVPAKAPGVVDKLHLDAEGNVQIDGDVSIRGASRH